MGFNNSGLIRPEIYNIFGRLLVQRYKYLTQKPQ